MRAVTGKRLLFSIGRKLLDGVGSGQMFEKVGDTAVHIRRSLSDEEIAGLDPAWVALPAIDRAG